MPRFVMSELCNGPGPAEEQGRSHRDVPRFVIGCEDDEHDMDQMDAGMKKETFPEENMEDDDENESVSNGLKLHIFRFNIYILK